MSETCAAKSPELSCSPSHSPELSKNLLFFAYSSQRGIASLRRKDMHFSRKLILLAALMAGLGLRRKRRGARRCAGQECGRSPLPDSGTLIGIDGKTFQVRVSKSRTFWSRSEPQTHRLPVHAEISDGKYLLFVKTAKIKIPPSRELSMSEPHLMTNWRPSDDLPTGVDPAGASLLQQFRWKGVSAGKGNQPPHSSRQGLQTSTPDPQ